MLKCVEVDGYLTPELRSRVDDILGKGNWYEVGWAWDGGYKMTACIEKGYDHRIDHGGEPWEMFLHFDIQDMFETLGDGEHRDINLVEHNMVQVLKDGEGNEYELVHWFLGYEPDGSSHYMVE